MEMGTLDATDTRDREVAAIDAGKGDNGTRKIDESGCHVTDFSAKLHPLGDHGNPNTASIWSCYLDVGPKCAS